MLGGRRDPPPRLVPYLLLAPGPALAGRCSSSLPNVQMFLMSLSTGAGGTGLRGRTSSPGPWRTTPSVHRFPDNFGNSIVYGGLATLCASSSATRWPTASPSAAAATRTSSCSWSSRPFFTSFLIRTISWRIILGNDGPFLASCATSCSCPPTSTSSARPLAVVAGLTYEFLPFMVLPLYVVAREDRLRLIEAARDLYAGPWRRGARRRRRRGRPACGVR